MLLVCSILIEFQRELPGLLERWGKLREGRKKEGNLWVG